MERKEQCSNDGRLACMALCARGDHQGRTEDHTGRTDIKEATMAINEQDESYQYRDMSRAQIRKRHREQMKEKGIIIGCNKVVSAKANNREAFATTGRCMVCCELSKSCKCDDRSAWTRTRIGNQVVMRNP